MFLLRFSSISDLQKGNKPWSDFFLLLIVSVLDSATLTTTEYRSPAFNAQVPFLDYKKVISTWCRPVQRLSAMKTCLCFRLHRYCLATMRLCCLAHQDLKTMSVRTFVPYTYRASHWSCRPRINCVRLSTQSISSCHFISACRSFMSLVNTSVGTIMDLRLHDSCFLGHLVHSV